MELHQETNLPYWATVAFIARCARRYADAFGEDSAEPASTRVAVEEAVRLAEERASLGNGPSLDEGYLEFDGKFFDNYDILAITQALGAYAEAARNTLADLSEDPQIEPLARRNLTAICLASLALVSAFQEESDTFETLDQQEAIDWVMFGEPSLGQSIAADLQHAERLAQEQEWTDETGVSPALLGPLWPSGRPANWSAS